MHSPSQDLSYIGADFAYKTFFGVGFLRFRDLTPKKVLMHSPSQDMSDIGADFSYKTFLGVGFLEIQGSNPKESLDTLT